MRYRTDSTWLRAGDGRTTVVAGSPLRRFRLSAEGGRVADRIERGDDVEPSGLTERLADAGAIHPSPGRPSTRWTPADVTIVTPQLGGATAPDDRIVVDDGSVPPIAGATTRLDLNRGPAAARNVGRALVETELIAFVDADVIVDRPADAGGSWLDALLPHFDDPEVGLVAPRVLGERHTSLDMGDEPARIRSGTRVGYVPAATILVRASAFDDVGGFDEAMRFGEDVDFVWRLDAAGWSCRYEPGSSVWHSPRSTWSDRLVQQIGYGSSAAPLALRHPQAVTPFRTHPSTAAAWVLGTCVHPVASVLGVMAALMTAVRKLPDLPVSVAARLAMHGQVASGRQLGAAVRREWWPIVVALAIVSRRARRIALLAALADPAALPTDLAYGWGVWRGMRSLRTVAPIVPDVSVGLSASPARSRRGPRPTAPPQGSFHGRAAPPAAGVR